MTIVGEHDFAVRAHLIAARADRAGEIEAVLSHPQPLAQCARFLREHLPGAERRSVSSTAEAVRLVCESDRALGGDRRPFGGRALRRRRSCARGSRTRPTTSPASSGSPRRDRAEGGGPWKTSLVFSELGEDHPGRPGRGPAGVLQPRGQPVPNRVAAPAPGPRPLHVLLRPRGRGRRRRRRRSDRGAPHQGGIGADPGLLPRRLAERHRLLTGGQSVRPPGAYRVRACVEFPGKMARVLVLNATYEPINVCTLRRAAVLLLKEKAELLERRERALCTPSG